MNMAEKEFCVTLIKCLTEALLKHTQNESEALKMITIGVQLALKGQIRKDHIS